MLYLVTQRPKPNKRDMLITMHVIVEADNAAAAVREAVRVGNDPATEDNWFGPNQYYCEPKARRLQTNVIFST